MTLPVSSGTKSHNTDAARLLDLGTPVLHSVMTFVEKAGVIAFGGLVKEWLYRSDKRSVVYVVFIESTSDTLSAQNATRFSLGV
jgi:hypothetical protein